MAKNIKTNAMRILENNKITYNHIEYDIKDDKVDGVSVSHKIGKSVDEVYKTLVSVGHSKENYVFVIPVDEELDLKKAAKSVGEKSIEMIKVSDITKVTGYIRGGCSPIGMKKDFKTVIQEEAKERPTIVVSAGKIGHQIELNPMDLIGVIDGEFANIIK